MNSQKSKLLVLSFYLIMLSVAGMAQSPDQNIPETEEEKPYEISAYMGSNRIVNLMVVVRQLKGVTLKVKDPTDTILHELQLKKSPRAYHIKLNFEDSQSGQYQLEISDGRNLLIRRIEVVDVPAIESQRYITFTSPFIL
ncbi:MULTISPECIES: hypothetical protein [unclassified Spirosoma]|uniref:hypothetical protein n=1 Tax=unclassified Spirosoma TaxID=2621999 RepID=UPI00095B1FDB|nr:MULTISPECIES: hypothetical protein [unclassified Spirosoma]MBN8824898.1 hypothetical protein [Spirosoma sp.]OJW74778.1 MAG: hypothetical protein BGO59_28510 [Spirosoma sp. 48-14]